MCGGVGACAQGAGFVCVCVCTCTRLAYVWTCLQSLHMAIPHRKSGLREIVWGRGVFSKVWTRRQTFTFLDSGPSCMTTERQGVLMPIPPGCGGLNMMMLAVAYGIQPGP